MNSHDCNCRELLNKIRALECELDDANEMLTTIREDAQSIVEATDERAEYEPEDECDCEECS